MKSISPAFDLRSTGAPTSAAADPAQSPEAMAKRFFILTMIGIVVYVSAIILLLSGAD